MSNTEAQNEEILALQSIYDTKYFIVDRLDPPCGRYSADVQLVDPFYVVLKNGILSSQTESNSNSSQNGCEELKVEFLPPINLYFEYPEGYPSDSPPAFFLSCSWLSYDQLSYICKQLDNLWIEGDGEVVLYQWIQFLKEETLSFLSIDRSLDITELSKYKLKVDVMNNVPLDVKSFQNKCKISDTDADEKSEQLRNKAGPNSMKCSIPIVKPSIFGGNGPRDLRAFLDIADGKYLKSLLKDYNEFKKSELFSESYHVCNICFCSKVGFEFVTFRTCRHFFCMQCIKSYFELMITEGSVHSLNCPHDKCSTQADGSFVKEIVNDESFERYDSLLLVRTLETMSDIAYCPRSACQCPLLIDVCGRIGTCPACNFVFCPFCKMAYHGVAPCNFSSTMKQQICNDYLQGDSTKKAELETRHGKRAIKSLVEDHLSEKWIGSNSKHCPHCNASIEKTEGCNKMTCFRCGIFFCWLCKKQLKASNPYAHYSERGSECYDKLFPDEYMDDEFMFQPGAFLNY